MDWWWTFPTLPRSLNVGLIVFFNYFPRDYYGTALPTCKFIVNCRKHSLTPFHLVSPFFFLGKEQIRMACGLGQLILNIPERAGS